jgi:DNA mismatch repair protein MutH
MLVLNSLVTILGGTLVNGTIAGFSMIVDFELVHEGSNLEVLFLHNLGKFLDSTFHCNNPLIHHSGFG